MSLTYTLDDGSVVSYVPSKYTGTAVNTRGDVYYYLDGNLHQDTDEPAVLEKIGTIAYYKYGKAHRVGGPSFIWYTGCKEYSFRGMLHNIQAPAFDYIEFKMYNLLNKVITEKSAILLIGKFND